MPEECIMEERYFPVVVQALAGSDYTVYAYFTDGTIMIRRIALILILL